MCPKLDGSPYEWEKKLGKGETVDKSEAEQEINDDFDDNYTGKPLLKAPALLAAKQRLGSELDKAQKPKEEVPIDEPMKVATTKPPTPPQNANIPKPPQMPNANIPTPPQMPQGKKPPPPKGGPKGALGGAKTGPKKIADMSAIERDNWIGTLKHGGFYPSDEDLLTQMNISPLKAGKQIEAKDVDTQKKVKEGLEKAVRALVKELFEINQANPKLTANLIEQFEAKAKVWKTNANGLEDAYDFLNKQLPKFKNQAKEEGLKKELQEKKDPEYASLIEKNKAIQNEFDALYKQYKGTQSEETQAQIYKQMQDVIKKLDTEKGKVQNFTSVVNLNKETLKGVKAQIKRRISELEDRAAKLEMEIKPFENNEKSKVKYKDYLQQKRAEIAELRKQISNPPKDIIEAEKKLLSEAIATLSANEEKQVRAQVFQNIFTPPTTWNEVNNLERKKQQKAKPSAFKGEADTKGMESNDPQKREFDIQFLSANEIANLAFFFAREPADLNDFLGEGKAGHYELMNVINGALRSNPALGFDVLMDIANERIVRKDSLDGTPQFAPGIAQLLAPEFVQVNESVKPDYKGFLDKAKNFKDTTLNSNRGITFEKSGGKYFEYARSIDLTYLKPDQLANMGKFFLNNDKASVEEVTSKVNRVLKETNLSFEDVMDVAFGYIKRTGAMPENVQDLLSKNVSKTKAPGDLYTKAVQQRKDYIEEQKRLKAEEEEKARKLAEEQRKAAQEKYGQAATDYLEAAKGEFKLDLDAQYGITELNLEKAGQFRLFEEFVKGKLENENDKQLKQVILEQLKSVDPRTALEVKPPQENLERPETVTPITTLKDKTDQATPPYNAPSAKQKDLTGDLTALSILRNVLDSIDIKNRYENAYSKKSFLARYKPQHKSRPEQINMLQDTLKMAVHNLNTLINLKKSGEAVNEEDFKVQVMKSLDSIDAAISKVDKQLRGNGHSKSTTSGMGQVIDHLKDEVTKMRVAVGVDVEKPKQNVRREM